MNFLNPAIDAYSSLGALGTGASMFPSAFAGAGAAAGAAGAGGAASGLLGLAGGPIGLGIGAAVNVAGAMLGNKAADASRRDALNRGWETYTANIAADEYQKDRSYGRQLRALGDVDKARRAGVTAFDDFQNLLSTGRFTSTGASRALSNPLFSRS